MKREQILSEALPYIREFYGSFVVIKIGGHAMIDNRLMEGIIEDIVLLRLRRHAAGTRPRGWTRDQREDGADG